MMQTADIKKEVIRQLQQQILTLHGYKKPKGERLPDTGLGPIETAFPDNRFPVGTVHEFISYSPTASAATNGFITALMSKLIQQKGICLWLSTRRTIFPAALTLFGMEPERIIFVDLPPNKNALWAVEEALKCKAVSAVIGELSELDFTQSRRLQLAVEQSQVTGFIHRYKPRSENTLACLTRWQIKPLRSHIEQGAPGVGLPRWNVELQKVRNGRPGSWQLEWAAGNFQHITTTKHTYALPTIPKRKIG